MIEVKEQVWQRPELFDKWMDKVRVGRGVNRSLPHADKDIWFDEVKDHDLKAFLLTMGILARGGKFFPEFAAYYQIYNDKKDEIVNAGPKTWCGYCIDGWVIVDIEDDKTEASYCSICYPESKPSTNPHSPGLRWVKDPIKHNAGARLSPEENKSLSVDLRAVLEKMGVERESKQKKEARERNKSRSGFEDETEYQSEKERMART